MKKLLHRLQKGIYSIPDVINVVKMLDPFPTESVYDYQRRVYALRVDNTLIEADVDGSAIRIGPLLIGSKCDDAARMVREQSEVRALVKLFLGNAQLYMDRMEDVEELVLIQEYIVRGQRKMEAQFKGESQYATS